MGSTVGGDLYADWRGDHPHIHGEHSGALGPAGWILGSPPYTWGAPIVRMLIDHINGITPIYMGSTTTTAGFILVRLGSPPYTWGARA